MALAKMLPSQAILVNAAGLPAVYCKGDRPPWRGPSVPQRSSKEG